jgi:hypothetical protein
MSVVTDATRNQFEVESTSPKLYKYGKEGKASKRSLNLKTEGLSCSIIHFTICIYTKTFQGILLKNSPKQ